MLDSDVLDIIFAMQVLFTMPGICVIPLKSLSNHASANTWEGDQAVLESAPMLPAGPLYMFPAYDENPGQPSAKSPSGILGHATTELDLSMSCSMVNGLCAPSNVRTLHHSHPPILDEPPQS
ncbi:hypothetical protein ACNFBR_22730 [Pseudomonas sp. NY11955]|uniref:hypothetical protein n=1 Tax=Pseudomonas sp. NY11955 TaxID=3400363 RepID=UPI003A844E68